MESGETYLHIYTLNGPNFDDESQSKLYCLVGSHLRLPANLVVYLVFTIVKFTGYIMVEVKCVVA